MKLFLQFALYVAIFLSALQVVIAQHEARRLFVELQTLEKKRDQLKEEWGRLQLEQSTWAINDRIETIARTELGMKMPEQSLIMLLSQ